MYKQKFARWCFTSFDIDLKPVLHDSMQCLIYQKEKCPESGKLHWQGGFQLKNRNGIQLKSAKKLFHNQVHLEPMMGSWEQTVAYCTKESSRVEVGELLGNPPSYGNELKTKKVSRLSTLFEEIKKGTPKRQIIESDPESYIRNHNAIDKLIKLYHKPIPNKKFDREDFNLKFIDWDKLLDKHNTLAYVIQGPSGIGKTQWAYANFNNPLVIRHIDDLHSFDNSVHDGLIFDDMDFRQWPRTAQIHLLTTDEERTIHARYQNVTIPKDTKMIFTCNEEIFTYDEAINRRHKKNIIKDNKILFF